MFVPSCWCLLWDRSAEVQKYMDALLLWCNNTLMQHRLKKGLLFKDECLHFPFKLRLSPVCIFHKSDWHMVLSSSVAFQRGLVAVTMHYSFLTNRDSTWLEAVALLVPVWHWCISIPTENAWSIASFSIYCMLCICIFPLILFEIIHSVVYCVL